MPRRQGYYIEHNGEQWQSVFPEQEANKSQLHSSSDDAFGYMHFKCGVPAEAIVMLPVASLLRGGK